MNAPSSHKRYLSVWLRRLTTDRLTRGHAPAQDVRSRSHTRDSEPLVVVEPVKGALRLAAMNDAAARLGLNPGMALADARAMYPRIAIADADPDADRRTLIAIADWCDRYTPLVGLDPPDGLLLDISGCAHLFGGEAALRRDIVARLERQGFQARAAIADTVGCAWATARYGDYYVIRGRATSSPPHSPSKTGVNALSLGEGIGGLRPPFLARNTPTRSVGYRGDIHHDQRKLALSPPLSRKREREQTEVAATSVDRIHG